MFALPLQRRGSCILERGMAVAQSAFLMNDKSEYATFRLVVVSKEMRPGVNWRRSGFR